MKKDPSQLRTVLVTDCGSTTTKALLFEKTAEGWRQTFRGEAPTTVEEPLADVTLGALNAFTEIEELSERKILDHAKISIASHPFQITDKDPRTGIDLYLSTSSAGGGLQMMVAGVVREMSTQSAERAALGAGAIVMDAVSADDRREDHERIEKIRHIRPDIVLITGGVDGGDKGHVVEIAEIVLAASPRPRFGDTLKLPIIYAGNKSAAGDVAHILDDKVQLSIVDNVRPTLEEENLGPAREAIHELFLTHVMSHSPGYSKLLKWSPFPIMPTPAAVGNVVDTYARKNNLQVLCVDIGGATTDVFSVFKDRNTSFAFNRTVSANFGMSYSVANVLVEAGPENIARWLPYEISDSELRDRLRNKMIRPTTIPQTLDDLILEQAVCREALRLSLNHHRSLAVGLSGVQRRRGIADIFAQTVGSDSLVNMMSLDMVIGSGGVLSHAPNRLSAALMMIEGFGLEGLTQLTVDSIFMMPHLGVFAALDAQAAEEIFIKDCLINIGHAIVPIWNTRNKLDELLDVFVDNKKLGSVKRGMVERIKLGTGKMLLRLEPKGAGINVGAGPGQSLEREIDVGLAGLILDGRNRPIQFLSDRKEMVRWQHEMYERLELGKI